MADSEETELSRREAIKLGAAATLAASLGVAQPHAAQSSAAAASQDALWTSTLT